MPQTVEAYKKLAQRDLELIMEQKVLIGASGSFFGFNNNQKEDAHERTDPNNRSKERL